MKNSLLAALGALVISTCAHAQTVELATLRSLELEFQPVVAVDTYPGQPVAGRVWFRSGEAIYIPSPGRVQQVKYLVEPGASVVKGQPFAELRGPEMHHVEMNYESSAALAAGAAQRYQRNKPLYESKSISESQWQEISEKYYSTQLEYEHMRHFFELVVEGDGEPDALTLAAPLAGVIDYDPAGGRLEEGDNIALFLPRDAIRLEVALPALSGTEITAVRTAACELAIERVSAMTDGLFVQAWTQSLPASCQLMLGQRVIAVPLVRAANAFRVPKTAVFQMQRHSFVWVRQGESLQAAAVTVLGVEEALYVVRSETPLAHAQVLASSVSAVQGVLLGLGEE